MSTIGENETFTSISAGISFHTPSTHSSVTQHRQQTWKVPKFPQDYLGDFLYYNLHGLGQYTWHKKAKKKIIYDGSLYVNYLEGYGSICYENGTTYEGLFKDNFRFGPGILHQRDTQDVGLWYGTCLMRLCYPVNSTWVPRLAKTPQGKVKLLKYRKLVSVCDQEEDISKGILRALNANEDVLMDSQRLFNNEIRNRKSNLFNQPLFDTAYFNTINCLIEVPLRMSEIPPDDSLEHLLPTPTQSQITLININKEPHFTSDLIDTSPPLMSRLGLKTKKVQVSDLVAWNNGQFPINIMKHCFCHRYEEHKLSYDLENIFSGDRCAFGPVGKYEKNCVDFLKSCCEPDETVVWKFLLNFDINPDLSDARGNSGIFYAASNDHHSNIIVLCDFGANLDELNDDCLTPVNLCILRYLAVLNHVKNWEKAFLKENIFEDNEQVKENWEWHRHVSLVSILSEEKRLLKDRNVSIAQGSRQLSKQFLEKIHSFRSHQEEFDSKQTIITNGPYHELCGINQDQDYILGTSLLIPPKGKGKKSAKTKKASKKAEKQKSHVSFFGDLPQMRPMTVEERNTFSDLSTITETIRLLLKLGASGNFCSTPFPPIILASFTLNPILMEILLSYNANPDTQTTEEGLTPIHILIAQKLNNELVGCIQVLLDYGADPNLRANPTHWPEHKTILIKGKGGKGDKGGTLDKDVEDEGKTPLHMLAMRYDFKNDPLELIPLMASTLVYSGASPTVTYLGHVPLNIAVLRGNIPLIRALLRTNLVNPNEPLGEGMGIPLTTLTLKRFFGVLTIPERRDVIDALIDGGANTLSPIPGGYKNVADFMDKEYAVPAVPAGKTKKKKKKPKKNAMEGAMIKLMLEATRRILNKHMQSQAVQYLYDFIQVDMYNDEISKTLAKLVKPPDAVRIMQLLVHQQMLSVTKATPQIVETLVKFVVESNPIKMDVNDLLENFSYTPDSTKKIRYVPCELDKNEEKYAVCFYCAQSENKKLDLCPKCFLIYFCSKECNIKSNSDKSHQHRCNILFYGKGMASTNLLKNKKKDIRQLKALINDNDDLLDVEALKRRMKDGDAKQVKEKESGGGKSRSRSSHDTDGSRQSQRRPAGSRSNSQSSHKRDRKHSRDSGFGTIGGVVEKEAKSKKVGKMEKESRGEKEAKGGKERKVGKEEKGEKEGKVRNGGIGAKHGREGKGATDGKSGGIGAKDERGRKGATTVEGRSGGTGAKFGRGGKEREGSGGIGAKDRRVAKGRDESGGRGAKRIKREKEVTYSRGGKEGKFTEDKKTKIAQVKGGSAIADDGIQIKAEGVAAVAQDRSKSPNRKQLPFHGDRSDINHVSSIKGNVPNNILFLLQTLCEYFPDFDFTQLFLPFVCLRDGQLYYRFVAHRDLFIETYSV